MKVPYMLVVGEKEMNDRTVAVRKHGEGDKGTMGLEAFAGEMKQLVNTQLSGKKPVTMA
jgi:threonyl-tRNA synthetase